jgi:hypothetical protein
VTSAAVAVIGTAPIPPSAASAAAPTHIPPQAITIGGSGSSAAADSTK